jgi:hypothetical protein
MIENHINEQELLKKIIGLFEYRLFPTLISSTHDTPESISQFTQDLIALQTAIYYLDAHLEGNWVTDPSILKWHWDNIESKLHQFSLGATDTTSYLNHIRKYEKHELELRVGKTPLRFDMEYFYFYKSCDVKLLRRLIYEHYKLNPSWGQLADWRYYDLVTEVNDDVEDLFEDLDFINGNRFLISLILKGRAETKASFTEFLDQILAKSSEKHQNHPNEWLRRLHDMTVVRIDETKALIEIQLEKISNGKLLTSQLVPYLNQKGMTSISHHNITNL